MLVRAISYSPPLCFIIHYCFLWFRTAVLHTAMFFLLLSHGVSVGSVHTLCHYLWLSFLTRCNEFRVFLRFRQILFSRVPDHYERWCRLSTALCSVAMISTLNINLLRWYRPLELGPSSPCSPWRRTTCIILCMRDNYLQDHDKRPLLIAVGDSTLEGDLATPR